VYCRRQGHLFQFANAVLPSSDSIRTSILRARDSATGSNGIPYSAYEALPDVSSRVFGDTISVMSRDSPLLSFRS